jgi:invasion protein IalB
MGFPLDHWNHDCIRSAIGSFGCLLLLENDRAHLARLLVKARVIELEAVPHFLVISKSKGFQGQYWAIQCEILEEHMLGPCMLMNNQFQNQIPMVNLLCMISLAWANLGRCLWVCRSMHMLISIMKIGT